MSVVSDGTHYEKIILFGGIQNNIKSHEELKEQRAQHQAKKAEDKDDEDAL